MTSKFSRITLLLPLVAVALMGVGPRSVAMPPRSAIGSHPVKSFPAPPLQHVAAPAPPVTHPAPPAPIGIRPYQQPAPVPPPYAQPVTGGEHATRPPQ